MIEKGENLIEQNRSVFWKSIFKLTIMSSSNLAQTILEGGVFDCPICLDRLNNPKYLPCLHNFCEECLHSYLKDSNTKIPGTRSSSFPCPVCRAVVIPPNPNASIETWASQMPGNKLITALLEEAPLHQHDHFCDPCKRGDETNIAGNWCQDCSEFLCENCNTSHKRMRFTAKHRVLPAEQVQETATKGIDIPEPCLVHQGKNMEVYCLKHQKMACVMCLADEHRNCQHIRSLDLMAAHMSSIGGAASLLRQLQNILHKSETFRSYKELTLKKLDEKYGEIKKRMVTMVEDAKSRLDELHEAFTKQLDECHDALQSKLTVKNNRILRFQKTVENCTKMVKMVSKRASSKQLFIQADKVKKQVMRQLEDMQKYFKKEEDVEFSVNFSDSLERFSTIITSLGTVRLITKEKDAHEVDFGTGVDQVVSAGDEMTESIWSVDNIFENLPSVEFNVQALTEQHVMKLKDIESGENNEFEISCWFTGGSFLSDGRLLLADNNNCSLKLFNQFAVQEKTFPMAHKPFDIACGSDDDIFVSFAERKFIVKFKLKKTSLVRSATIKRTKGNWGIDICKGYILTAREESVDVLNYQGRLLRTIKRSGYNMYVCGSNVGKFMYYTDYDDVVCRKILGKDEVFRFSNPELSGARGLATDAANNVYVCGIYSHNIYKINEDGSKGKAIIPEIDNIREPFALGIDRRGEKVFVTSYNEEYAVTFFQMSKAWTL